MILCIEFNFWVWINLMLFISKWINQPKTYQKIVFMWDSNIFQNTLSKTYISEQESYRYVNLGSRYGLKFPKYLSALLSDTVHQMKFLGDFWVIKCTKRCDRALIQVLDCRMVACFRAAIFISLNNGVGEPRKYLTE